MKYIVLGADDEIELLDTLEFFLKRDDIELIKTDNGIKALELFVQKKPHLVLLDIMMTGMDGYSVLRKIREKSYIPAIMLTARTEDYDKILGLELGADDYITKPFNPMEVVARIKAQLRRNYDYLDNNEGDILKLADLELDCAKMSVKKSGRLIELTGTEYRILELLLGHPGRIFTKKQIYNYAWQNDYVADDNTVMVHISNLRAKIEEDSKHPVMLKTIKGLGYRFENDRN